jgi:hypothetical protein
MDIFWHVPSISVPPVPLILLNPTTTPSWSSRPSPNPKARVRPTKRWDILHGNETAAYVQCARNVQPMYIKRGNSMKKWADSKTKKVVESFFFSAEIFLRKIIPKSLSAHRASLLMTYLPTTATPRTPGSASLLITQVVHSLMTWLDASVSGELISSSGGGCGIHRQRDIRCPAILSTSDLPTAKMSTLKLSKPNCWPDLI